MRITANKLTKLEKIPRLNFWKKGLWFNYSIAYNTYYNHHFRKDMETVAVKFVGIQIRKKFCQYWSYEYDGNRVSGITILGISFVKGDQWDSEILDTQSMRPIFLIDERF